MDRDLNDIAVFTKVVEARSFTGAARELGMPRSTVSRRVAELERRLGARLLQRTTRKLSLTDVGARFYERCAQGLSAIEAAEACVRATHEVPRGKVRVTAPFSLEPRLGPVLASFLTRHPEVSIEVELTQRLVDLIEDNFDLAIRATGHLPDSSLVARLLASGDAGLFAHHTYLERHGPVTTPAELALHPTISFGHLTRSWTLFGPDAAPIEAPIAPRLVVNSPSLALATAIAGLGIALLPFDFAERAERAGLRRVLPEHRGQSANLYLVYPSAKLMSATLRALCEHLLETFSSSASP